MYTILEQLPSKYIPYTDEVRKEKIKIRPLTYGEVLTFSESKDNFIDLMTFIKEQNIIKGIDFGEITVGDWEFLELSLVAMSYADPIYTVDLGDCEDCKKKFSELPEEELYIQIGPHTISKIPKVTKKIKQGEINFREVIDEVTSLGEAELEDGKKVIVDFYRLKHYKTLIEEKKEDSLSRKVELVSNVIVNNITTMDYTILIETIEMMDHGLDSTFIIKCPNCEFKKSFMFEWRFLQLRPYTFDNASIRSRISFGKTREPIPITKSELQRGTSTLRPSL